MRQVATKHIERVFMGSWLNDVTLILVALIIRAER